MDTRKDQTGKACVKEKGEKRLRGKKITRKRMGHEKVNLLMESKTVNGKEKPGVAWEKKDRGMTATTKRVLPFTERRAYEQSESREAEEKRQMCESVQ